MNNLGNTLIQMGYHTWVGIQVPDREDGSIARRSVDCGFQINEKSNFESQFHIALSYSMFFLETLKMIENKTIDYWVIDRSILDHLIYTIRNERIQYLDKMMITNIAISMAERYPVDYVFLCDPIPVQKDDAYRSSNVEFQKEMEEMFRNAWIKGLKEYDLDPFKKYCVNFQEIPLAEGFSHKESIDMRIEMCLKYMGLLK